MERVEFSRYRATPNERVEFFIANADEAIYAGVTERVYGDANKHKTYMLVSFNDRYDNIVLRMSGNGLVIEFSDKDGNQHRHLVGAL